MIHLKDIDLTDIEAKKQSVIHLRETLEKEQKELRDMLVARTIDYYGTTPKKYYTSIEKQYVTEDKYHVQIKHGNITILKQLSTNLSMRWGSTFNENTEFNLHRAVFWYSSGRNVLSPISKEKIANKYKAEMERCRCILEEEQTYDPFEKYKEFYSFIDFFDL